MRCGTADLEGVRGRVRCGLAPHDDQPVSVQGASGGVRVVRDVHDDSVSAALTGPFGGPGETVLQPFFQLDAAPRRPRLRRVTRLWPLAVFLVVLLFFAIAGLTR